MNYYLFQVFLYVIIVILTREVNLFVTSHSDYSGNILFFNYVQT